MNNQVFVGMDWCCCDLEVTDVFESEELALWWAVEKIGSYVKTESHREKEKVEFKQLVEHGQFREALEMGNWIVRDHRFDVAVLNVVTDQKRPTVESLGL